MVLIPVVSMINSKPGMEGGAPARELEEFFKIPFYSELVENYYPEQ